MWLSWDASSVSCSFHIQKVCFTSSPVNLYLTVPHIVGLQSLDGLSIWVMVLEVMCPFDLWCWVCYIVGLCAYGGVSAWLSGASGGSSVWMRGWYWCVIVFKDLELRALYGFTALPCSVILCGMLQWFYQSLRASDNSSFLSQHYYSRYTSIFSSYIWISYWNL